MQQTLATGAPAKRKQKWLYFTRIVCQENRICQKSGYTRPRQRLAATDFLLKATLAFSTEKFAHMSSKNFNYATRYRTPNGFIRHPIGVVCESATSR